MAQNKGQDASGAPGPSAPRDNDPVPQQEEGFSCDTCHKKFSRRDALVRHQRAQHQQASHYLCLEEPCVHRGIEFNRWTLFQKHMLHVHGIHRPLNPAPTPARPAGYMSKAAQRRQQRQQAAQLRPPPPPPPPPQQPIANPWDEFLWGIPDPQPGPVVEQPPNNEQVPGKPPTPESKDGEQEAWPEEFNKWVNLDR